MALTKVAPAGIGSTPGIGITIGNSHLHTLGLDSLNGNFTGIVTAGTLKVTGNLEVEGTTTTLDTELTSVDKLEVAASNNTVGVAITQSGSGDILNLYDGSTEVFSVADGGDVTITDSIIHSGDTNTKIRFPANDTITAETGGSERLRITSAGLIGVGTTDPDAFSSSADDLVLRTTGDTGITIRSGTSNSGNIYFANADNATSNNGILSYLQNTKEMRFQNYGGGSEFFTFYAQGNERLRITSAGLVGIGTNDPSVKLEILGENGNQLWLNNTGERYTQISIRHDGTQNAALWLDDTEKRFDLWAGADHGIRFKTGGNNIRATITPDGNIGIGTTAPGALLSLESNAANAAKIRLGFDGPRYYDIFRGSTTNSGYLNFYGSQSSFVGYVFGGVDGEWMRIKNNGYVGVGTDNPGSPLHVYSTQYPTATITRNHAVNYPRLRMINISNNGGDIDGIGDGGAGGSGLGGLRFAAIAAGISTVRMTLTGTGNFGIGEDAPTSRLVVQEANASGDVGIRVKNDTTTDGSVSTPTTASVYLTTSTGDFNTFYIQARRYDNDTWMGYADPRSADHQPTICITNEKTVGIGLSTPGAILSLPAGESNTPRFAIESAVDDNDFTITQYEDGNGTYTMLGQNVKLNSGGNTTILDSGHKTAGIQLDARNHGAVSFLTGGTNAAAERVKILADGTILSNPGGATSSIDGGFTNLELRKDASGEGGSLTLVNDESADATSTCSISVFQNYRNAGEIIFGRENANNWQSSAGSAASNIIFKTNSAGTHAERLRITSSGNVKINAAGMVGGTNAVSALLQIKSVGQYDGIVLGNAYAQACLGTDGAGGLKYTGNAAPANLGGGLKFTHQWYSGSAGGGGPNEIMSLSTNGDLYLGPYDPPGSYTSVGYNVPYQIKVAPYGWNHHSEIAAISMGSHVGTGQDDGQIIFKTAQNVHSDSTGVVERLRITENGILYVNGHGTSGGNSGAAYTPVRIQGNNGATLGADVRIRGGSTGYTHASVSLQSTSNGNTGGTRGLGTYMYDEVSDIEWYAGRPYSGNDFYMVTRDSGVTYANSSGQTAQHSKKVMVLDNARRMSISGREYHFSDRTYENTHRTSRIVTSKGVQGTLTTCTIVINCHSYGTLAYDISVGGYSSAGYARKGTLYINGALYAGFESLNTSTGSVSHTFQYLASQKVEVVFSKNNGFVHPVAMVDVSFGGDGYFDPGDVSITWS